MTIVDPSSADLFENNLHCFICLQMDSGQGDLGTLANVVTSLANLSDSLKENLNNGDTSDSQHEEQSASEITRSVSRAQRGGGGGGVVCERCRQHLITHRPSVNSNHFFVLAPCVKLVASVEADYLKWKMFVSEEASEGYSRVVFLLVSSSVM